MRRSWPAAVLLSLTWCPPARAALPAALLAQGEGGVPIVEYGIAILATLVVLLVVCWPARRE
jgi:hypothetical protein